MLDISEQSKAIEIYTIQGTDETYVAGLIPQEDGQCAATILGKGRRREGYLSRKLFSSVGGGKKYLEDFRAQNNELLMKGKLSKSKMIKKDFINLTKQSFIDTLRGRLT